ncbi:MAG: hypothetical protein MUF49_26235 [Oculatellaceae cyanobacterium Prado106]|jgi:hypothetical protein|nr:hypothetical protein [Oculatellaceae cyanobacterium Prado106]
MDNYKLRQLVNESLWKILRAERLRLCQLLIPDVSDREMQDIQANLGQRPNRSQTELITMTEWCKSTPPQI